MDFAYVGMTQLISILAFKLFLLMDPVGNIPVFVALLRNFDAKRQRAIIFRELCIALFIIIIFALIGNMLLDFLEISSESIFISGGLVLFLIALKMIFPQGGGIQEFLGGGKEPFLVPLAIPLIAGPSVLAAVIIFSHQQLSIGILLFAVFIAWLVSCLILLLSPFLYSLLGERVISALEKLMGLILILIAVQMMLDGLSQFLS